MASRGDSKASANADRKNPSGGAGRPAVRRRISHWLVVLVTLAVASVLLDYRFISGDRIPTLFVVYGAAAFLLAVRDGDLDSGPLGDTMRVAGALYRLLEHLLTNFRN